MKGEKWHCISVCLLVSFFGGQNAFAWKKSEMKSKIKKYQKNLKEEDRIWKVDNKERQIDLIKWKNREISKLEREKDKKLEEIEEEYNQQIKNLQMMALEKSNQYQLKSDIAFIKSVKLKKEKFLKSKPILKEYYTKLTKIEGEFLKKVKELKLDSYEERVEFLNDNRPEFFPHENLKKVSQKIDDDLTGLDEWISKKYCRVKKYYMNQQIFLDHYKSSYEYITPLRLKKQRLINQKKLVLLEVDLYKSSYSTLKVMKEEIKRNPRELKRVFVKLNESKGKLKKVQANLDTVERKIKRLESKLKFSKKTHKKNIKCNIAEGINEIRNPVRVNLRGR